MNLINAVLNAIPVALVIACIIAITIKEFTKALVSTTLGDQLPKRDSRLTLNPIKHIEPIGLFLMVFFRVGWGKPVETSSLYYKNRKRDTIITYTLPSLMNFVAGIIFSLLYFNALLAVGMNFFTSILLQAAFMNFNLALFNIIPVPPLDGAKILSTFLSPNAVIKMASNEKLFQIALIFLIVWWNSPLTGFINRISLTIVMELSRFM